MDKYLHGLLENAIALLAGLTPAALGAAVSLSYEKGLSWRERFTQLAVGTVVSYFAGGFVSAVWPWGTINPFVLQAITFTTGMIAFKATPKFIASCSDALAALPANAVDRVLSWLPRRKDDA
ncbi:MAG: hypothetical protein WCS75_11195 [Sphingomonas sp.]|jgi:hypothetical protein|uniref:hypothetical protein n=1 Tax=Sphingomonas sp. TaxID=28214 RepID=UPI003566A125